ncbi:phosphoribosylaminoimidazole carboxylase [Protomyces lactucae-debilis]|uniref:Phosphoribosylaminoimidazole carboxylase n=1 Tax=Protomyces lactucae-debilis TaxID=2754530 RepID=A0A1Y2FAM9_PROLT|nr:phosphoribosylaminoimidazole carboxylase [Protomyces lactucae-debilis]ORY79925.1 phosphoribosylaminoimidazole carboxylase [Protomyces lactucae-debilis]
MALHKVVGVLGGGQLGRMLQQPASRMGIELVFLDPEADSPAKQICASDKHVVGKFTDEASIRELAQKCDLITVEIEHVNTEVLQALKQEGKRIYPDPDDLALIKDKFLQKEQLKTILGEKAVAEQYAVASDATSLQALGEKIGYPYVLKSRTDAYDGRGNYVVRSAGSIAEAVKVLADRPLYGEKMVPFVRELAVMVVRTRDGQVHSYPCVETQHELNICKTVFAPAAVNLDTAKSAKRMAEKAIKEAFVGAGVFGIELFHLATGEMMLNEIAPRPHNSGHYTIEACTVSQYEAHLRAILDLPLPPLFTKQHCPAIMYNLLGAEDPAYIQRIYMKALELERSSVHLYGKKASRPQRKMGHVTFTGRTMAECQHQLARLLKSEQTPTTSARPVKVAVIMGSDSDGPSMQDCCDVLTEFGVGYEKEVVSAHRTPDKMYTYAHSARIRGIQVIIAAAGGAAHLPGMVAALTSLPVIGVPINATCLDGMDSLLSQVQMPRGIPVATVAINNSTNAALLAIRILGVADDDRLRQIEDKMARNRAMVERKNEGFMVTTADLDPLEAGDSVNTAAGAAQSIISAIKDKVVA